MARSMRRTVDSIVSTAVMAAGLLLFSYSANAADQAPGSVVLDNEHLRIEIDPGNGAITRILDKQGQIQLVPVDGLAENFRLVLRGPGATHRTILGRNQKLSSVSKVDGVLDLAWKQPLADTNGGKQNLQVRMKIQLAGESLEFRVFVDNETEHKVAQVSYPMIGGLAGFGGEQAHGETFLMLPTSSPSIKKVAMPFGETRHIYPGRMCMSFSSVYNTKAGRAMYFASHDTVARLKYYRFFEQSSPTGKDVFACIEHMPFTPAGGGLKDRPLSCGSTKGTRTTPGRSTVTGSRRPSG